MHTTDAFLERCNALMQGQDPEAVLRRALEIVREPEQWTNEFRAITADRRRCRPEDPDAAAWCIEGAVSLACNPYGILPPYFMLVMDDVAREYGCDTVNLLEDALDHAGVLEFLLKRTT